MNRSTYSRGLAALGSLAISDKDLKRIENLAHEMKDNAWALKSSAFLEADRIVGKVRTAMIANTVVTAASTGILVFGAVKVLRGKGYST
jgi:flagellar hook assembly protein FlgD